MQLDLLSLFLICCCSFVAPLISNLIPNKVVPETVFLLILGMILGPHVAGLVQDDTAISLMSDLGLGFLFLLAGYEIDTKDLTESGGKEGLLTWAITFALALVICVPIFNIEGYFQAGIATSIILTTTAFGTIIPILKERGLQDKPIGRYVVEYGVWGELCPILAMALLLSTRAKWLTFLLLCAFILVAVLAAIISVKAQKKGSPTYKLLKSNAENNSQLTLRLTILLLVGLVALSDFFDLDMVLGAFAAGFVLRTVLPDGDPSLEHKLNGIAYGFFIPLFFVVSGTSIDPLSVTGQPLLLIAFISMIVLVRALPIFISMSLRKDSRDESPRVKASVALYCTTALPLIVAVCSVAVASGAFQQQTASTLIAAGGITVLLMPFLASIVLHTIDAELPSAIKEYMHEGHLVKVLKRHREIEREKSRQMNHVLTRRLKK